MRTPPSIRPRRAPSTARIARARARDRARWQLSAPREPPPWCRSFVLLRGNYRAGKAPRAALGGPNLCKIPIAHARAKWAVRLANFLAAFLGLVIVPRLE